MDSEASSAVAALRGQMGDHKIPDITRKVTACVLCRKQKLKCHMGKDGHPPCVRCKKRGLSCTVNRSLQMILESDADWKAAMERKMRRLEAGLDRVARHHSIPLPFDSDDEEEGNGHILEPSGRSSPQTDAQLGGNYEIVMDPDSGPAAIPGSVISPVAVTELINRADQDIIKRGIVTLEQAEACLDIYQNRLDHFLYRIIGDRKTLDEVRKSSPLLLAAICAVGALHLPAPYYEKCYQEFAAIAAAQTFSRRNNVDDIRGLCIAAFWLSSISWTCSGLAVRIATELHLHRSIFKALSGDRLHYLRTRLYYLVYICDHQFSVMYGRPAMTREDDSIRGCLQLLTIEHAVEDDARLVSQIQRWSIGSEIYDTFGVDVERALQPAMIGPLRRLSARLDQVRADWAQRFTKNKYVGNYPAKGVHMHCDFAKLYLSSMAFRGVGKPGYKSAVMAADIDEFTNAAVQSAKAVLKAVIMDAEIQDFLNGLPTYFNVMIAFAVVFLLKVTTKYSSSVRTDHQEIRRLVQDLVYTLDRVTAPMHPRHLLASVAKGIGILLDRAFGNASQPQSIPVTGPSPAPTTIDNMMFDPTWQFNGELLNNLDMGDFDFLAAQDSLNGFQPDMEF